MRPLLVTLLLCLTLSGQAALADDPDQSAIRDISLSLDVAQVHRTEQPFARLREVGAALAEAMDGVLCDQNGQPLPAMAMDPIAIDLEQSIDKTVRRYTIDALNGPITPAFYLWYPVPPMPPGSRRRS